MDKSHRIENYDQNNKKEVFNTFSFNKNRHKNELITIQKISCRTIWFKLIKTKPLEMSAYYLNMLLR